MIDLYRDGYVFIVWDWCLFATATIFVFIRLYVQLRFRKRPWRELFVVAAWLCYMGSTICESLINAGDGYNPTAGWDDMPLEKAQARIEPLLKLTWISGLFLSKVVNFCKMSLLCFYGDLTPRAYFPKTWWVIVFSWVICIIQFIYGILSELLSCNPISANWKSAIFDRCFAGSLVWSEVNWAITLFTDFLVYFIPIVIIRNLGRGCLTRKQKREALATFGLGFLNVTTCCFIVIYFLVNMNGKAPTNQKILDAQMFLVPFMSGSALVIVCASYVKRLWRGIRAEDLRPELNSGAMAERWAAIAAAGEKDAVKVDVEAATPTSPSSEFSATARKDSGRLSDIEEGK